MRRSKLRIGLDILTIIVVVPVFLVALAVFLINVINWDHHKDLLIKTVAKVSPYRIDEIEGIRVGLWRSAELGFKRLAIHAEGDTTALKSIASNEALVKIEVWPLIHKNVIVQNFNLDATHIQLGPSKPDPKAPQKDEEEKPFTLKSLPAIFVNSASIHDFRLGFKGDPKAKPFSLVVSNLGLTSPDDKTPAKLGSEGVVNDLKFQIVGEFGSFDDFRADNKSYPIWIRSVIAEHYVEAKGSAEFARNAYHFDVDAHGQDLTEIKKAFNLDIGTIPPYKLGFVLNKTPNQIRFEDISLVLGKSSVKGNGGISLGAPRTLIQADLLAPVIYQKDLAGLFKSNQEIKDQKKAQQPEKPAGQYFSDIPINASGLRSFDGDFSLKVNEYQGEKAGTAIDGAVARVQLNRGNLVVDPLRFEVSGGYLGGKFNFDARKTSSINIALTLGARHVDLNTLLGPIAYEIPVFNLKPSQMAKGIMSGHLDLKMHGKTPMQMARSTEGPVQLAIEKGQLNATVVEAFGLDIAETLGNWAIHNPMDKLQCSLFSFEAKKGVFDTKAVVIATNDTDIIGSGELNLPGNKADFKLEAHPKDFSVGSIRSPILIKGPINEIKVSLEKKPLVARGAAAVALGFVNPALALVALVEPGLEKNGECQKLVADLKDVEQKSKKDVSTRGSRSVGR